mmetsp:Transcript_123141/g.348959  ORF Transcript_123141/g.348959 Transcript_123141/m.348959 type:complete len:130 (-) Transcript_123141:250-639(-)
MARERRGGRHGGSASSPPDAESFAGGSCEDTDLPTPPRVAELSPFIKALCRIRSLYDCGAAGAGLLTFSDEAAVRKSLEAGEAGEAGRAFPSELSPLSRWIKEFFDFLKVRRVAGCASPRGVSRFFCRR